MRARQTMMTWHLFSLLSDSLSSVVLFLLWDLKKLLPLEPPVFPQSHSSHYHYLRASIHWSLREIGLPLEAFHDLMQVRAPCPAPLTVLILLTIAHTCFWANSRFNHLSSFLDRIYFYCGIWDMFALGKYLLN